MGHDSRIETFHLILVAYPVALNHLLIKCGETGQGLLIVMVSGRARPWLDLGFNRTWPVLGRRYRTGAQRCLLWSGLEHLHVETPVGTLDVASKSSTNGIEQKKETTGEDEVRRDNASDLKLQFRPVPERRSRQRRPFVQQRSCISSLVQVWDFGRKRSNVVGLKELNPNQCR